MNNKSIIIILGIAAFIFGIIALQQRTPKDMGTQYELAVHNKCVDSTDRNIEFKWTANTNNEDTTKNKQSHLQDSLFLKKVISGTESYRLSADGFSMDIPAGAVKEEKEISIRGLRYEDIQTLDANIINVTSNYAGYRCMPHGKFEKNLKLSIGYDTSLIPEGYYPSEIRTFFYDEEKQQWENLPVDSIDYERHFIISRTDHFTDFINGILRQPEIPETGNYTPTSIRNLEYANPLEGMNIMEPPSANNNGNCSMNFPIKVPAGRNGMTPQISISYSSDTKDGIMGTGWSLNIPSITVDTRWGVPPYSALRESESYLVNGELIVEDTIDGIENIARRKPLYVKTAVARNTSGACKYAYLTEGRFDKITRYGDSTSNYWWKIIDRDGVEYVYGDSDNTRLQSEDSLRNIAVWGLARTTDTYGNFIRYTYTDTLDTTYRAKQFRIDSIIYTNYGTERGAYVIKFVYDTISGFAPLSARYGFLTSDISFLSKIRITYNNQFVKCYRFEYADGVASRKVLKAIAEITDPIRENDTIVYTNKIQRQGFYVHFFDYYNENSIEFQEATTLDISPTESINILGINIPNDDNISKNTSYSITGGGSACVGFNDEILSSKSNSFGINYHYTFGRNNQKSQIMDLNGDGIVDRVEKTASNGVKYYKGVRANNGSVLFSNTSSQLTIPRLGKSTSHTHSIGTELLLSFWRVSGMIGYSYSMSKDINTDYFIDVNGDGFADYISDGNVFLNFPNQNGNPSFTDMSSSSEATEISYDNCYSFGYGGNVGVADLDVESSSAKRDPVIMWESPLDCYYKVVVITKRTIGDNIYNIDDKLIQGITVVSPDSSSDTCFYKSCPAEWNTAFPALYIPKGGYIFFHIHSDKENTVEEIKSSIIINAVTDSLPNNALGLDTINTKDADGKRVLHFRYDEDAVVQDGKSFTAMKDGNIKLSANLISGAKSDTLNYCLTHEHYSATDSSYTYTTTICKTLNSGQNINNSIVDSTINVAKYDRLSFRLESNSNVDWSDIQFTSSVKYIGDSDTATYHPSLGMSIYAKQVSLSRPVLLNAGNYSVRPDSVLMPMVVPNTNADVYLTVKIANRIIAKKKIANVRDTLNFNLDSARNVYFDYTVNGELDLPDSVYLPATVYDSTLNLRMPAGLYAKHPEERSIFGNLYRGWGQFSYKDDSIVVDSFLTNKYYPISFGDLHIDTTTMSREDMEDYGNNNSDFGNIISNADSEDFDVSSLESFVSNGAMGNASNPRFLPMSADISKGVWIDPYRSAYVSKDSIGSGYGTLTIMRELENNELAEGDNSMPDFSNPLRTNGRFPVVNKVGRNVSHSFSASALGAFGCNHTWNESFGLSDMMDMNGDGYPDIVTSKEIQYTLPNGDMSNTKFSFAGDREVNTSYSKGEISGASVSFKPSTLTNKTTKTNSTEKNISTTAGLNFNESDNKVRGSYIDINSDGLPDIVSIDDTDSAFVEYNLGYKFSPRFPINNISSIARNISRCDTLTFGLNFNYDNYSISGGVNSNTNTSGDIATIMDINSDGFVDIVTVNNNNNNTLYVYLNNGTDFGSAQGVSGAGISRLSENKTYNISGNVSGTFGFPIMYVKVTASLYADFAYSFSNEKLRLMDLNGDGAIDILSIGNNGATVRYGIPQKRNLLKKVTTPALGEYEMYYSLLYSDIDNPSSKWIMTGLKINDNDGGFTDGNDLLQYKFSYSGMKYHRIERESYGFAEVTTKIVDNLASTSPNVLRIQKDFFHTENGQLHGLKYKEVLLTGDSIVQTRTYYNWTLNDINTGTVAVNPECGGEFYPRLESEKVAVYGSDTSNAQTSVKRYEYTKYGNISKYVNRYKHNDSVTAEMNYSPDISRHILGELAELTAKSSSNQIIRKMERRYGNNGNIVQVKNYLSGNEYAATDFDYDNYGNIIKVTYPANESNQRTSYRYSYDSATNTYLSLVIDDFGDSIQLCNYDYRFGKPTCVVAQNGTRTLYSYYSDGKMESVKAPTDLVYSARFEYWVTLSNQNHSRWARVIHHDTINAGNTFVTQTVCDGLGRTMQTARKSVVDGSTKYVVSGKNAYDVYGRIVQTYQPQAITSLGNGSVFNGTFANPTAYTYDCLDRQLSATTPDGITVRKSYDISPDAFGDTTLLVTTTYPQGRILKSYTDSRGLQTTAKTVRNAGDIVTKFKYSPMGELLVSTDPEGDSTTYIFDWLGRLTKRTHPDAGNTTFRYDKAGNLVSKKTQKLLNTSDSIIYVYKYNRLTEIHYPHNPEMNVYYEYGTSGLNKGLVTRRQDGVCVQSYTYNEMGDVVENIRTFAMPSDNLMTLATSWEYDTWGRTKSITYPDGETIDYRYDNAGKVTGMYSGNTAIVSNIKYDKYENRTRIYYGNGAYNTYTYNTLNLQLSRLRSYNASGTAIQNIAYTYDSLYNITKAANSATGYIYTHNYAYDTLNRVISSTGTSTIGSNTPTYDFAIAYSPSGRILNYSLTGSKLEDGQLSTMNLSRRYSYANTTKPHAPSSVRPTSNNNLIGSQSYQWDANGNYCGSSNPRLPSSRRAYSNEENRLSAIYDDDGIMTSHPLGMQGTGAGAAYLYDADGERVWKFAGQSVIVYNSGNIVYSSLSMDKTFYPTPQTTFDKHNFYKHYFIGGERICTQVTQYVPPISAPNAVGFIHGSTSDFMLGMGNQVKHSLDSVGYSGYIPIDPVFNSIGSQITQRPQKYFYHYNHQGSVALVTYQNGTLQQHLQYLPYGGIFVDHRPGSYSSTYTFSAKEKDSESGYTYFGARYYSDNIMQWLSIDPMSDMRPGVSPYSYCQWNPIGRKDDWGMLDDVYITGTAADDATEQLQSGMKNITVIRDENTGKLSYTGTAKTKKEKEFVNAVDSKDVTVNIQAQNEEVFEFRGNKYGTTGGSFLGNEISKDVEGNLHINTYQAVNPDALKNNFSGGNKGKSMFHELSESYQGGLISLGKGVSSPMAGETGSVYPFAHFNALPQGHEKLFKRRNITNYGKSTFTYRYLFEHVFMFSKKLEQETNNSEDKYIEEYVIVKKILNSKIYNIIIVEVIRNNGIEVLLSKKTFSKPQVGKKLKVNDTCLIKMNPIFDLPKNLVPSIYDKGRYIINNRIIHIRYPHYAYHLNYSSNLHGLYYCPTHNE